MHILISVQIFRSFKPPLFSLDSCLFSYQSKSSVHPKRHLFFHYIHAYSYISPNLPFVQNPIFFFFIFMLIPISVQIFRSFKPFLQNAILLLLYYYTTPSYYYSITIPLHLITTLLLYHSILLLLYYYTTPSYYYSITTPLHLITTLLLHHSILLLLYYYTIHTILI